MNWHTFWSRYDRLLEVVVWAWDSVMLYLCAVLLIPLTIVATIGTLLIGPAPASKPDGLLEPIAYWLLALAPLWLIIAGYARFHGGYNAQRLQAWIDRAFWIIIYTACALMGLFALVSSLA
jgi:hypothetical protein